MRRLATALLALLTMLSVPTTAGAQAPPTRHVDVLQVNGLIDPVIADAVADAVRKAERTGAVALLIQLDSGGGVLSDGALIRLRAALLNPPVPIAVWVGPTKSKADGQALAILDAARFKGAAPGTRVDGLDDEDALAQGRIESIAPTIGDFLVQLDDKGLDTAEQVERGGQPRRQITVRVVNAKPGLLAQLLHTAASPSVAFFLLALGLALVVLEFFTAGVGAAAVTGAGALVLGAYGLAVLPTRPWAVGLVALGILGYAIDLQAGSPRAWTLIGTVSLVAGSVSLYDDGLRPGWFALVGVVAGIALFMVAGMPAMVRARFSTPTIGRESMVGELGAARTEVNPEGTVEVRGAPWRARTNRATPIAVGDRVRVTGIDGLLLEVEPESGGAKDYRDRSGKTAGQETRARES